MADLPAGSLGPLPEAWDTQKKPPSPTDAQVGAGPPKSEGRKLLEVLADPLADMRKYVLNEAARKLLERVNSSVSGFEATAKYGENPITYGMMRLLLPAGLVDDLSGVSKGKQADYLAQEEGRAKAHQKKYGSTRGYEPEKYEPNPEYLQPPEPDLKAPGPISRYLGAMVGMAADPVNVIVGPGNIAVKAPLLLRAGMNLGSAAFTGVGVEGGGDVGEGVGRFAGGEEGAQTGRAVGNVVGGVVRAPVTSGTAAAGRATVGPISRAYDAARRALFEKRAGDERTLRQRFSDEWSALRAESQGFIKQRVQEQLADVLDRDPAAREHLAKWEADAKAAGIPVDAGSLAQRSQNPLLVETQKDYIPQTKEQAIQAGERLAKGRDLVLGAYRRITGRKVDPNTKSIEAGLEELRVNTNAKIGALADESVAQRDTITNWGPPEAHDAGARLRELHEGERVRYKAAAIDPAYNAFRASKGSVGAKDMEALLTPVLGKAVSEIDPSTVSENLRGIIDLVKPTVGPGGARVYRKLGPGELLDINQAINRETRALAGSTGKDVAISMANLTEAKGKIEGLMQSSLPPESLALYEKANRLYGETYAPGFAEDVGRNIRRKAGSAHQGQERIINEKVIPAYLDYKGTGKPTETVMRQFDAAFGGQLTGNRVGEAYELLGKQIETDYARKVLNNRSLSAELHEIFMKDYEAALSRVPETAKRLDKVGDKIVTLGHEEARIKEAYTTITGHPITRAIGIEEARATMAKALANPGDMSALVAQMRKLDGRNGVNDLMHYVAELGDPFTNGQFDGGKIRALLNAGKASADRPGGLERLFTEALGEKAGKAHYERLHAIASIADRMESTVPTHLRPQRGMQGPVQEATGSTAASLTSDTKAMWQGRNSLAYMGSIIGSRYINSRVQKAWLEAEHAALYNPKDSAAVLDLMKNPQGPWHKATVDALAARMGKEGKSFIEILMKHDLVLPLTAQGAALGVRKTGEDEKRRAEEQAAYREGRR